MKAITEKHTGRANEILVHTIMATTRESHSAGERTISPPLGTPQITTL